MLKELRETDNATLINFRIRKILMICSNYDAFILEEDGQIENQIYKEYLDLNLSNPPKFVWVTTSAQAQEVLEKEDDIDMVICMYNVGDKDVFSFASELKSRQREIPFVLLTHFSKEIYRRLALQDTSAVDYMFSWHGNADLIVAIIKLFEDLKNADDDILGVGVTNGSMGYFPDNSAYDEGGYETRASSYAKGVADVIVNGSCELLEELKK